MKLSIPILVFTLGFCVFMGITAGSLGVGAAFPNINRIAAPVVCPGGQLTGTQHVTRPYPGKTVTTVDYTCVNPQTGASVPVDKFSIALIAGTAFGVVGFIPLFLMLLFRRPQRQA